MEYVNVKSVSFWAGLLLILKGVARIFGFESAIPIPDEVLAGAAVVGIRKAIGH